ncbi:MAG TPA: molybdopterin-guanine dinucleotide biosynthesis protein B [Anaerolineae bacterium]|nr:molybdopterin-guanine dinucleotide biosynthesis protein B [Anaerolineae bacterium]
MKNHKEPLIIGFYGESHTGKTSLIERIIRKLNDEGYKIATIKKTNINMSIDSKGKDTARLSKAGARLVVFASPIETSYLIKEENKTQDIIKHIEQLGQFDFIFIEGANERQIKKIRLGNMEERENTIFTYNGEFEKLVEMMKANEF